MNEGSIQGIYKSEGQQSAFSIKKISQLQQDDVDDYWIIFTRLIYLRSAARIDVFALSHACWLQECRMRFA